MKISAKTSEADVRNRSNERNQPKDEMPSFASMSFICLSGSTFELGTAGEKNNEGCVCVCVWTIFTPGITCSTN